MIKINPINEKTAVDISHETHVVVTMHKDVYKTVDIRDCSPALIETVH